MEHLDHIPAEQLMKLVQQLQSKVKNQREVDRLIDRYNSGVPDELGRHLGLDDVARTLLIMLEAEHGPTADMLEQVAQHIRAQHEGYVDVWRHMRIGQELSV